MIRLIWTCKLRNVKTFGIKIRAILFLKAYRKTGTRDPSETLVGHSENLKNGTWQHPRSNFLLSSYSKKICRGKRLGTFWTLKKLKTLLQRSWKTEKKWNPVPSWNTNSSSGRLLNYVFDCFYTSSPKTGTCKICKLMISKRLNY